MNIPDDPILEAALQEALGGRRPPNLIAATLARAQLEGLLPAAGPKTPARPRPWLRPRYWGWGLAAAAVVLVGGILAVNPHMPDRRLARHDERSTTGAARFERGEGGDSVLAPRGDGEGDLPQPGGGTPDEDAASREDDRAGTAVGLPPGLRGTPMVDAVDQPLSRFAPSSDRTSWLRARYLLEHSMLPGADSVHPDQFLNGFAYGSPEPAPGQGLTLTMEAATSRYGRDLRGAALLRVTLRAEKTAAAPAGPNVLTLLVNLSGSMARNDRLDHVRAGIRQLAAQMKPGDRLTIVGFADSAEILLPCTDAADGPAILNALEGWKAEGGADLAEGLELAAAEAARQFDAAASNRIVLCTDTVSDVVGAAQRELLGRVSAMREKGIPVSVAAFGLGAGDAPLLARISALGGGTPSWADSAEDARTVFDAQLQAAPVTALREVLASVEFNPAVVKSWRLIGREDGEETGQEAGGAGTMPSGGSFTALYELKLHEGATGELAKTTVSFEREGEVRTAETSLFVGEVATDWERAGLEMRLAAAAAELGEILAGSHWARGGDPDAVVEDLAALRELVLDPRVDALLALARAAESKQD